MAFESRSTSNKHSFLSVVKQIVELILIINAKFRRITHMSL